MAVNILVDTVYYESEPDGLGKFTPDKGVKKHRRVLEHHRSPSGLHNKANYLVVESGRDINKVTKMLSDITMSGYKITKSWYDAASIACDVIEYNLKNVNEWKKWKHTKELEAAKIDVKKLRQYLNLGVTIKEN